MNRPLRFCMITTFYPPYNFGGDGISVHRLANELALRGHSVDVIHCIDSYRLLARRDPEENYQNHPNVTVHGLHSRFGFLSPVATQQTGFPLFKSGRIRRILEKGFDVIHYHNVSLVGGPRILEYGHGIKLYTLREYWLVCPTHVLLRFDLAPCTRRYCLLCSLAHRRPPQWWRHCGLLEAAVKHVDAFIAPSRFSGDVHHRMGLKIPVVHLPNFVPEVEVELPGAERHAGEMPGEPYFLFVGRLEKLKGLQTLIPVFRRYRKAHLWIAGAGSYEPRLRRLCQGSAGIRFLGHVSGPGLRHLYRRAVALIVPSINFEASPPLVALEALREQTPVIVRNLGSMPELIRESGGGLVYDTDEDLVAAMDKLLADPASRREWGLRGHQAYQEKYTAKAHLERYFGLIRRVAAAKGEPAH